MTTRIIALAVLVLGCLSPLSADTTSVDRYPRGLGLNAGTVNGIGLSYRYLPQTAGYQVTGILFKADSTSASNLNYSLGAGVIQPLGAFVFAPWLEIVPYVEAAVGSTGTVVLPTRLDGIFSVGLSSGLEWLFWEHFSVNVEIGDSFGVEFPSNRAPALGWATRPWATVSPQLALYFRF